MRNAFAHPGLLLALAVIPGLALLAWRARRRRRADLVWFFGGPEGSHLVATRTARLRGLCFILGLLLLGLGMAGPQWGRDWEQAGAPGRDLVVVLDRSRSMLAEKPSRLERGRNALLELAEHLKQRGRGQRVALVVFAAEARLICPLTYDLDHFREVVAAIDPERPDPDLAAPSGAISGTRIGQALRVAVAAAGQDLDAQDILLLSDGDDPARDGEWREGVLAARSAGIPVYTIGLGDPDLASPIPGVQGTEAGPAPLEYEGKAIVTRLEEAPLREIAEKTGGAYEPARRQTPPLGPLYQQFIASRSQRENNEDALPVPRQRQLWFLTPALCLLAIATVLGDRRGAGLNRRDA